MYFEAIKIFCDVVRQRSFSRAAAMNHISQSAASQNVLQLEKSLGVRLLDRSKRPFKLTPEGQVYYDGCKALVEQYGAVEAQVKSLRNEVAGTVSVAAIYSVGLGDMSTYVQQFASRFPQADVKLAYLHPQRVIESVANEEVDLGLVSYPKSGRDIVSIPWRDESMVVVARPDHPLAERESLEASDLDGQAFVGFADNLVIRKEIDRQLRKAHCEVDVVMTFDNIETIKKAVEIGEGISLLPEPTVKTAVMAGTLVAIPLTEPVMVRPLGIIHRRRTLTRTVQAFIDLIRGMDPDAEDRSEGTTASDNKVASGEGSVSQASAPTGSKKQGSGAQNGDAKPGEDRSSRMKATV